jgi:hypothetical protein
MDGASVTRDQLPEGTYRTYRKIFQPKAIRMVGPFHCLTGEGNIASCADGWLAIDSQGYPYPIGAAEFETTYEQAENDG